MVIVIMRSVSVWLCVQGQSAELNLYFVWEIIYWNGAFWGIIVAKLIEILKFSKVIE